MLKHMGMEHIVSEQFDSFLSGSLLQGVLLLEFLGCNWHAVLSIHASIRYHVYEE